MLQIEKVPTSVLLASDSAAKGHNLAALQKKLTRCNAHYLIISRFSDPLIHAIHQ